MTPTELAEFIRDALSSAEISYRPGYTNFDDGYSLDHGIIDGHYNLIALAEKILQHLPQAPTPSLDALTKFFDKWIDEVERETRSGGEALRELKRAIFAEVRHIYLSTERT